MSDFKQAIEWMKEGKRVRRKAWTKNLHVYYTRMFFEFSNGDPDSTFGMMVNFEATDWEIYCKEHEWIQTGKIPRSNFDKLDINIICENCGIEKPKESLSDKKHWGDYKNNKGRSYSTNIYTWYDVKDKIQNALRKLDGKFAWDNEEKVGDIWVRNVVHEIFKEEFGEDLL